MKYLFIISILICTQTTVGQTHTSLLSGSWTSIATWSTIVSFPSGSDSAIIQSAHTISNVTLNNSCQGLNLIGTYSISGGSLTINDNLDLHSNGTINISGGNIYVGGSFDYDGEVNNTSSGTNFIEVDGNIRYGGANKIITNDGSIRIYGELAF